MVFKDRVDYRPGGLNRVFTGEQRAIAGHRVGQKPLVGRLLSGLLFEQVELSLVADEVLASALDASRERDGGAGESRKRR